MTYQTGLPITHNLDWLSVDSVDQIAVPEDAWVDWDAASQKFITAGEKFPDGTTAKVKSVVTFPADLYDTVKWHDGSSISVADFVMSMIIFFDRAKPESSVYDEAAVPGLAGFLPSFKGYRIINRSADNRSLLRLIQCGCGIKRPHTLAALSLWSFR